MRNGAFDIDRAHSLLAHSFLRLMRVEAGYYPDHVSVMRVQLPVGNDLDVRSHASSPVCSIAFARRRV